MSDSTIPNGPLKPGGEPPEKKTAAPVIQEPITSAQFQELIGLSNLLTPEQLQEGMQDASDEIKAEPKKLAALLVRKNLLTEFQARKLLQGQYHGLQLGKYRILAPIGKGGMGAVYLARHSEYGLQALKVLPPHRAKRDDRTLLRFQREMKNAQRVQHPNLARSHEAGRIKGIYYIAMEYIQGRSLRELVQEEGRLTPDQFAAFFSEVCIGLAYAHARGLIHRDLKPSNIMVTPAGHAKILDFGLAFRPEEEIPEDKSILGGKGYVVGTMDYISPEQIANPVAIDYRADLYSLGCTMYYAITGQPPFPGGSSKKKMRSHLHEKAEPIQDLNPDVPIGLARVIEKLMDKDPDHRYKTADDVCEAIHPWVKESAQAGADLELNEEAILKSVTQSKEMRKLPEYIHSTYEGALPSTLEASSEPVRPKRLSTEEAEQNLLALQKKIILGLAGALLLLIVVIVVLILRR